MLDVARHAPRAMHDLDRGRSGSGPHRAKVGDKRRLRALPSAQIQPIPHTNPLANADEMLTACARRRPTPDLVSHRSSGCTDRTRTATSGDGVDDETTRATIEAVKRLDAAFDRGDIDALWRP
jgi:hypothetical protein